MFLTLESDSLEETFRLGRAFAAGLKLGDVVALNGDLGAGKTHFVQAIAQALDVTDADVSSPTYVLIQEYQGKLPICHIDAYRLQDFDEFLELGADELLGGECVALIEWASKVSDALPRDHIDVFIQVNSETSRTFCMKSSGRRSEQFLQSFVQQLTELSEE